VHNSIKFWNCPSNSKWHHYVFIDKETKKFNLTYIFSYKSSLDFSKKEECDDIIKNWQITFQALDSKENHFLDLLDDNYLLIKLTYMKNSLWFNQVGNFLKKEKPYIR